MKKQKANTHTHTTPSIYEGLNENQKVLSTQCIIIDKHGEIFRYTLPQGINTVTEAITFKFTNFDDFDNQIKPLEMIEWHQRYFDKALPPTNEKNSAQIALWVWLKLCRLAKDRTTAPKDPVTGSKTKNAARMYYRCLDEKGIPIPSPLKTPQTMACLTILETTCKENTQNGKKVLSCTEANLKTAIFARSAELKTRQDPWRIFQYYRPQLINAKVITSN